MAKNKVKMDYSNKSEHRRFIIDSIIKLGVTVGNDAVFSDFVAMCAIFLSNLDFTHREEREEEYLRLINSYDKQAQQLFPQMFDHLVMELEELMAEGVYENVLGDIYIGLGLSNSTTAQFFTPDHVCDLMAKIVLNKESANNEKGYATINDPCCGAGTMIIKAAEAITDKQYDYQHKMVAMAADIDIRCVHMCFVQLALYSIPAVVIHGNSMSCETYSRWYTPIYLINNWIWRETFTLDGKRCIEDLRIKCALEPMYAVFLQLDSLMANNEANSEKILNHEEKPASKWTDIELINIDLENGESETLQEKIASYKVASEVSQMSIFDTDIAS